MRKGFRRLSRVTGLFVRVPLTNRRFVLCVCLLKCFCYHGFEIVIVGVVVDDLLFLYLLGGGVLLSLVSCLSLIVVVGS